MVAYNGLCSDSDIVSIYVNALPDVDLGPDQTVIVGTPVQLIATGGANGATYSWSPILDLTDTVSASTIATPKVTTTYIVKVTNQTAVSAPTQLQSMCCQLFLCIPT